jgi:hypothetical protein
MSQLSPYLQYLATAPLASADEVTAATVELDTLLSRCSELRQDLVRMHDLLERMVGKVARPTSGKLPSGHRSQKTAKSPRPARRTVRGAFRQLDESAAGRVPVCSELARACRIALIESNEPAALETIYDRIQRRGSFSFTGYKHPFRAIILAMSAMVKRGEASALSEAGHRRWLSRPRE